jgi:hypothetical protein
MKSILGIMMFVAVVVITGGLYLVLRNQKSKLSDGERLSNGMYRFTRFLRGVCAYIEGSLINKISHAFGSPLTSDGKRRDGRSVETSS